MLIDKIVIKNFRGYTEKELIFKGSPVVLLSAANGLGKTTVIDAIEWCFTGSIGRLKKSYDFRSPNETERKLNIDGILKNRKAGNGDKVSVSLYLNDGQNVRNLCRWQLADELNPALSVFTLDGNEDEAKRFYHSFVGDSFYNFHYCDVQKSFYMQSAKRTDLRKIFDEFITNYDDQKSIAYNLELFVKDAQRYKKSVDDKLPRYKEELTRLLNRRTDLIGNDKILVYPKTKFYSNELTDINSLNDEELRKQKTELCNCGYMEAKKSLATLVENDKLVWRRTELKRIATYCNQKKDLISRAKELGIYNDSRVIDELKEKQRKLRNLNLTRDSVFQDGKILISMGINGFSENDFIKDNETVDDNIITIKLLTNDIEWLTRNNHVLSLMSNLSANKHTILEYRADIFRKHSSPKCPICGSESFANVSESMLLKEANEYIKQNGETVREKEKRILNYKSVNDKLCDKYIECFREIIDKKIESLEKTINDYAVISNEVQLLFSILTLLKNDGLNIDFDKMNSKYLNELIKGIELNILEDNIKNELVDHYRKILDVLGCEYNNDTFQQTYAKVQNLITNELEVSTFSCNDFVAKILTIDGLLANNELSDLNREINECCASITNLNQEADKYSNLVNVASKRATEIKKKIEELSQEEYEIVGPTLNKYFNKLSRMNFDNGINIVPTKGGISLIDDEQMNLVNVLSNGQISVFMLALFFAGIKARENVEQLKLYFIDDLTSCMDDVNMLAFVDLLKYQLDSKQSIDQFFFATCDNRISELIKYKLNGRGISWCELLENEFL